MSISINSIKSTINDPNNSLGMLCCSNKINKWSIHKPVNVNKVGAITDAELYNTNCGLRIPTADRIVDMIHTYEEDLIDYWNYISRTAPYRMADFLLYDHYADEWFTLTWSTSSSGAQGDIMTLTTNTDPKWFVNNLNVAYQYRNTLDLCLLINKVNTGTYYVCKIFNIQNASQPRTWSFTMPTLSGEGQYIIYPFMTDATQSWANGHCEGSAHLSGSYKFIMMPAESTVRMTQSSSGGGTHLYDYIDLSFNTAVYDYSAGNQTIGNIRTSGNIRLNGTNTGTWNVTVILKFTNAQGGDVIIGSFVRTLSDVVSSDTFNTSYSGTINLAQPNPDLREELPVRVTMSVTHNNTTQTTTWNQNILRGI